jgi:hypothetical protein
MEKRISERLPISLDAEITSNGKSFAGSIKNVSESGIGYIITSSIQNPDEFSPDKVISMSFQVPSGDTLKLKCRIIWFSKSLPDGKTLTLGMKLLDIPLEYREWINNVFN